MLIKKYSLDFSKALSHLLEVAKDGKTLAEKAIELIDFNQGQFFTLLPPVVDSKMIYNFKYGGIMPSYDISRMAKQVITTHREFSDYVNSFLKTNNHYALLEDLMLEVGDPHTHVMNVRMLSYQKEVYYLLDKQNSKEEIYKAIRKSGESWHFFSILFTKIDFQTDTLDIALMNEICKNVKGIIINAYDGESFVFWEKLS